MNIKLSSNAPILIDIANDKTVTLKLSGTNKVWAEDAHAGIEKNGDNRGSLIITSENNGILKAFGKNGAGIGGGNNQIGSNITISGGDVQAISDWAGAGIGGGDGNGSYITISGRKVKISSNNRAIGTGSGNTITPSNSNAVNVWQDTYDENAAKAYSNYTSTLDISSWTNKKLMIIFNKINVDSSNSSSGSSSSYHASCSHHYEWEVERTNRNAGRRACI